MVSDRTRQEVWQELLDIDRTCRYYEAVQSSATRYRFGIRIATLLLIAGSIAAILDLLPWFNSIVAAIVAVVVTGLTVWDAVADYSKKAAIAQTIHFQCSKLRVEIRDLWLSVDDETVDEAEMRQQVRNLALRSKESENWAGFVDITTDQRLNKKTTKAAYDAVTDRYNTKP